MKWLWSLSDRLLGGTGRLLLFFCSYPETGHAEMAAASARAGRKTLMVRFGGVKGGGREQFGGHRIAAFLIDLLDLLRCERAIAFCRSSL